MRLGELRDRIDRGPVVVVRGRLIPSCRRRRLGWRAASSACLAATDGHVALGGRCARLFSPVGRYLFGRRGAIVIHRDGDSADPKHNVLNQIDVALAAIELHLLIDSASIRGLHVRGCCKDVTVLRNGASSAVGYASVLITSSEPHRASSTTVPCQTHPQNWTSSQSRAAVRDARRVRHLDRVAQRARRDRQRPAPRAANAVHADRTASTRTR